MVALLGLTSGRSEFTVGEHGAQSDRVQVVVDYYGPTDFLQMDAHRLPDGMIHNTPDSPESQLVGGFIVEHPDQVAQANPLTYVTREAPPFLIVHGDQDLLVPHHQSELLLAALKQAATEVSLYTVKGGGHGGFTEPRVSELTREFFTRHLQ